MYGSSAAGGMYPPQQHQQPLYASQQPYGAPQQQYGGQPQPVMGIPIAHNPPPPAYATAPPPANNPMNPSEAQQMFLAPILFTLATFSLSIACCFTPVMSSAYTTLYLFRFTTIFGDSVSITDGYGCDSFTHVMGVAAAFTVLCGFMSAIGILRCWMLYREVSPNVLSVVQCMRVVWLVLFNSVIAWVFCIVAYHGKFCGSLSFNGAGYKLKSSFAMLVAISAIAVVLLQILNRINQKLRAGNEYHPIVYA